MLEENTAETYAAGTDTAPEWTEPIAAPAKGKVRHLHVVPDDEAAAPISVFTKKPVYEAVKRLLDILVSIIGIIITSPILIITALAIRIEDGGPAIYSRICVGKDFKPYAMYKFRSMVLNAADLDNLLTPEQKEQYMREVKIDNDPRITRVGRFIRKVSIDELPQLFTILKGDMSFVSPRPMVEFESAFFAENVSDVLAVKPGLTGYWQVYGRNSAKYETGERQQMELHYVENRSLWFDIKLFFMTMVSVFRRKGV